MNFKEKKFYLPDTSSIWETSVNGISPANDAVHAQIYSFKQIPASINARVAALTEAQ